MWLFRYVREVSHYNHSYQNGASAIARGIILRNIRAELKIEKAFSKRTNIGGYKFSEKKYSAELPKLDPHIFYNSWLTAFQTHDDWLNWFLSAYVLFPAVHSTNRVQSPFSGHAPRMRYIMADAQVKHDTNCSPLSELNVVRPLRIQLAQF